MGPTRNPLALRLSLALSPARRTSRRCAGPHDEPVRNSIFVLSGFGAAARQFVLRESSNHPPTPPLQEDQGVGQSKVLCGRTTTSRSNRRSNSLHTKFSPACCRPWRVRFGRCSCGSPGKAVRRPESFWGVGWRQQKMLGFWEFFFGIVLFISMRRLWGMWFMGHKASWNTIHANGNNRFSVSGWLWWCYGNIEHSLWRFQGQRSSLEWFM